MIFKKKSLLFLILLSADLISKYAAVVILKSKETIPVIGDFFRLTYVQNTGAAFGQFKDQRIILIIITIPAIMLVLFILKKSTCYLEKLSCVMIISGALGNFADRIFRGYVVDFLDFNIPDITIPATKFTPFIELQRWPVFNLADMYINIGAFFILIILFKDTKQ